MIQNHFAKLLKGLHEKMMLSMKFIDMLVMILNSWQYLLC